MSPKKRENCFYKVDRYISSCSLKLFVVSGSVMCKSLENGLGSNSYSDRSILKPTNIS